MEEMKNGSEFLRTSMTKLFWKYAFLALIGTMFSCLAVILDGFFMGNGVGEMALAGIAVAVTMMYFGLGLCQMLGVGGSSLAGIKMGDGDEEGARDVYGTVLIFTIGITVIIGALCLIFKRPLLYFLGATDAVYPYAADYAKVFFALLPVSMLGQVAYYFCRLAERPKAAAVFFVAGGLGAILVEYILVFKFHWGTAASAWDFVIGLAATIFLIPYLQMTKNKFKLSRRNLKIHWNYVWETIKIGFPMFLFNLCPLITTVIINNQIITQGGTDLHLAAFGIFNAYVVYVMNGMAGAFTVGLQPIASVNYGAKAYDRVRSLIKVSVVQSFIVLLIVEGAVMILAKPIVAFFAGGYGELTDITSGAMRINIMLFAFGSVATLVGGYFIGIEKNGLAILNSTTRVLIFAVPLLFILPSIMGLTGVWAAQPFADACAFVLAVICIVREYKQLGEKQSRLDDVAK